MNGGMPHLTARSALPRFRVNVDKQLWYDFGLGKGGDIFTLAGEFVHSCDFMEQAKFITKRASFRFRRQNLALIKPWERSLPLRRWR